MALETLPSVASGVFRRPFAHQVAFFRGKLGNLVPTTRWDDLYKSGHDRGFMVAGATKADLLSDLAAAVERTISEGKNMEAFRKDFMTIVDRHGWRGFTGDESAVRRAWRTRIVYQTNASTSYAAGRNAYLAEAGFPYLVYRHNDAVMHPRPRHLAWNGLTLPANDPFWQTHKPRNGWGCQCYTLGARSATGARRLGGRTDKTRPADWNKIDPKTGEPMGIDKGWGYAPGAGVAETVAAMAQKTTQWEYTLAKAYMQGVPEGVRDSLARSYRSLPSVADDTRRYAQAVLEGRDVAPYRTLGLLDEAATATIAKLARTDVAEYDYAIDHYAVRHIDDVHGGASEAARGQRPITTDDYAALPLLLNAPTSINEGGMSDVGRQVVRITGEVDGEIRAAAFEIRNGRRMLALQSMWIKKG